MKQNSPQDEEHPQSFVTGSDWERYVKENNSDPEERTAVLLAGRFASYSQFYETHNFEVPQEISDEITGLDSLKAGERDAKLFAIATLMLQDLTEKLKAADKNGRSYREAESSAPSEVIEFLEEHNPFFRVWAAYRERSEDNTEPEESWEFYAARNVLAEDLSFTLLQRRLGIFLEDCIADSIPIPALLFNTQLMAIHLSGEPDRCLLMRHALHSLLDVLLGPKQFAQIPAQGNDPMKIQELLVEEDPIFFLWIEYQEDSILRREGKLPKQSWSEWVAQQVEPDEVDYACMLGEIGSCFEALASRAKRIPDTLKDRLLKMNTLEEPERCREVRNLVDQLLAIHEEAA